MGTRRRIQKVFKSSPVIEGAGVHLKRAIGFPHVPMFDPFLLLDDFRSSEPEHYLKGFPWHPHRGIETITYVLAGNVEHGDSMGNRGNITAGDVQWMTAGSGIIHQEMPRGNSRGRLEGFQLWANLPASHKMMAPRYRDVKADRIPSIEWHNGIEIKIISGEVGGVRGPVRDIVIDPEYLDISIPPRATYAHPTKPGHTVFAYVIGGRAFFCEERKPFTYEVEGNSYFDITRDALLGNETLILFGDGDRITVNTESEPVRFLLISGRPLGEPVAWQGPIVMNTQEELRIAFDEYRKGTFIKQP